MAKNAKLKVDVDHENSLDNSADSEYMGMVEDGSYGSPEEGSQLVSQSFLENDEENTTYSLFSRPANTVTYKLIHMTGENTSNNMESHSPIVSNGSEYYVIGNPVEVFGSTTKQKRAIRQEPLTDTKTVTTKKRDDKRRATHNEVERRRRDKINTWITQLASLVPNSGLPDSSSKGGILAKACDYITELTQKQKKLEKLEVDNDRLVIEIMRLNQELTDLRKENTSIRSQLTDSHIGPHHKLKPES